MEKLSYEFEFITPAFIGGASPEETSELRPSSVVGVLRYWFRVIVGAYVKDTKELFKLEGELFGNQERAGKVWVRVRKPVKQNIKKCEDVKTCYVKNGKIEKFGRDCGKSYLGYGNILFVNFLKDKRYIKLRNYCEKQRKLKGTFFVKPKITECNSTLEILTPNDLKGKVEALLFIFSQLGFLGSRGRRGWGSVYLKPRYGNSTFKNWTIWNEKELIEAIKILTGKDITFLPFELYKTNKTYSDGLEALEHLGRLYREFRFKYMPDYKNIKNFLKAIATKNNKNNYKYKLDNIKRDIEYESIQRAFLGMPIIFRFSSDERLRGYSAQVEPDSGRMASPLIFRIIRLNDKNYSFIMIYLKNFIRPNKINLVARYNKKVLRKFSFYSLKEDIIHNWLYFLIKEKGIRVEDVKHV